MAHAENEVVINKPIDEVFAFIADGTNNAKWRPGVVEGSLKEGTPSALGAVYKQTLRVGHRTVAGDYKITVLEPKKQLSFAVIAGPARPTGDYYLSETSEGTKLRLVLDFQPKGLLRLIGPMINKTMQREVAQLAALKSVLESGQA